MKNAFTINVLFILFYDLMYLLGVFGANEVKLVSVMEGHSITFNSDVTDIQSNYLTLWRYGDDGFTIAQINRDKIIYSDVSKFNNRMKVNDQTGSLTITNTRTKHSGLYKIEISNSSGTSVKKFRLTVYDSLPIIEAEKGELKTVSVIEGDPANLPMEDVKTQTYDLIVWRFGDDGILIVKGDREDKNTTYHLEEIYGGRLKLNFQTGSLTITDSRSTDTGLYKVKISSSERAEYMRFILTVSGPGISSGGVAGIVIFVLLVISAAVVVSMFFYRRISSAKKHIQDVVVDNSVSVHLGDSVILEPGIRELKTDDEITWKFEGTSIAKMRGNQPPKIFDGKFKGKVKLDHRNGSLMIRDTNAEHAGLYKVEMQTQDLKASKIIKVSACDKLQVKEADSFTLSSGHTEIGNNLFTWKFGNEVITKFTGSQPSISVKESFIDRVFVESQTGSLNIKNSRTKDSGLYQLQISERDGTNKPEKKFSVTVREKINKVTVKEGESLTLNTEFDFIQRPAMIRWEFEHKCIAELIGIKPAKADVNKDERFSDRLELDFKTGSLTITNAKKTDTGVYTLKTDPERRFRVTVKGWGSSQKPPEQTEAVTIKPVSVMEGENVTLSTGGALTQRPEMIKWMFNDICIAEFTGIEAAIDDVNKHDTFRDRLELDCEDASLTIRNITTTDSGCYTLRTRTGDTERKFVITVSVRSDGENDLEAVNTEDPLDRNVLDPLLGINVQEH